jgi:hypothetical protein
MTGQLVFPPATRALLKCILLFFILVAIQVPLLLFYALAHNGCTKYVYLSYVESLTALAWQMGAISLGVHLIVMVVFMSDFLRRPRALLSKPALIAWACFVIWKVIILAVDLKYASRCGEARDYVYPEKFSWVSMDLMSAIGLVSWIAMIGTAIKATADASLAGSTDKLQV